MIRLISAGIGALMLAGCVGSLLESDAPVDRIYTLDPASDGGPSPAEPLDVRLAVARPRVAPGLGSERIAVLTDGRALNYYEGARWGEPAARVVQSFLVESLRHTGAFAIVSPADAPVPQTHLLDLELRDFQVEYRSGSVPTAHVGLTATLIDVASRRALVSFDSDARVEARADRLGTVVEAMEEATSEVARDIGRRLADAIDAANTAPGG